MSEQPSVPERTNGAGFPAKLGLVLAVIAWVSFTVADVYARDAPCLLRPWKTALFALIVFSFIAAGVLTMGSLIAGLLTWRGPVIILSGFTAIILFIEFASFLQINRERTDTDTIAIAEIRTIYTAEILYSSQTRRYGSIEDLIRGGLLPSWLADPTSDYKFTVTVGGSGFTIKATSVAMTYGCWDYFSSSADGVVRYSTDKARVPKGQSGQPVQ